ncbi:phage tail sheath family protein [Chitinimonas arctica]|uniref:Phage tail sheath family protein n=1 Tax=Chitinimonas arctica TaxID=2594795 RepID=A0A516SLH2_9NEIS|nr:phage tail sheath subtilisin-like domain-containing protein [Chitinimonas arctica]QDQ29009.1 phage tail sheath family protein [Chitinimonas arctica]
MPSALTYPGVYVEEISSGVRTITGVATSITAFVGRALRGPTDTPVTINSYGDFERVFGGLWADSALGYAVRDFYLNGGSQAVVVRLYHPKYASAAERTAAAAAATATAAAATGADVAAAVAAAVAKAATYTTVGEKAAAKVVADAAVAAAALSSPTVASVGNAATAAAAKAAPITKATLSVNGLDLEAKYEGSWGNYLRARIDHDVAGGDANLFNLSVRDGMTGRVEMFRNVSFVAGHVRQVDKVLVNESKLLVMTGSLPGTRPTKHPDPDKTKKENDVWAENSTPTNTKVADANVAADGGLLDLDDFTGTGKEDAKTGLYALKKADLFNLLCIPPYQADGNVDDELVTAAAAYCEVRRAMLLVDPPSGWHDKEAARDGIGTVGTNSKNAALFFPRLRQSNPKRDGQLEDFAPCGAVAGIFARTDTARGVWKAPAGLEATLVGVPQLSVSLNDAENGELNPLGINCLRVFPAAGRVVWGARTLQGDDRQASEWKYIPVRRTALYIEESLYRGTQWAVFEPNDEPLWAQLRLGIGAFMHNLFRQGAFQGASPKDAYFVKCDGESTTQNDIDLGIVNVVVGFAPLKPAEFVVIRLQQIAGQLSV